MTLIIGFLVDEQPTIAADRIMWWGDRLIPTNSTKVITGSDFVACKAGNLPTETERELKTYSELREYFTSGDPDLQCEWIVAYDGKLFYGDEAGSSRPGLNLRRSQTNFAVAGSYAAEALSVITRSHRNFITNPENVVRSILTNLHALSGFGELEPDFVALGGHHG